MTTERKELVAIPDFSCAFDEVALKQLAVMFDRIAILPLSIVKGTIERPEFTKIRAWLVATGVLFELDISKAASVVRTDYRETREQVMEDSDVFLKPQGTSIAEIQAARSHPEKISEIKERTAQVTPEAISDALDPQKAGEAIQRLTTNLVRVLTIGVRTLENLDAYAVIVGDHSSLYQEDDRSTGHDVLNIALGLPVPDEHVPWEQIVEYRHDPESQNQFLMLKNCLSAIASGSLTPVQVEETLEYLLNRYRDQMERHKIHTETKRMEAFIVTTAEVASSLEGFTWTTAAQSLFAIRHSKVRLLEGESNTPGSEVAYLIDARSLFSEG